VTEQPEDDEQVIETEEGSAGGPTTHDSANTRLRAETPGLLPEELDHLQEQIRTTRRSGGPNVSKKSTGRGAAADEEGDEVPPTETEQPPGPPAP
jgi:hypothetical protein